MAGMGEEWCVGHVLVGCVRFYLNCNLFRETTPETTGVLFVNELGIELS